MKKAIFIVENYISGGSDIVVRDIIDNIHFKKVYLFINKSNDVSNLLKNELPSYVELKYYGLITLAELGTYANSKKNIFIIFLLLKIFNLLIRYPLLLVSIFYFYLKFKVLDANVFVANNGGYPGGEYCRSSTIAAYFAKLKCFHIVHNVPTPPFFKPFKFIEFAYDNVIDRISKIICVSNDNANRLNKIRNVKQDVKVIHNGIKKNFIKKYEYKNNKNLKLLNVASLYPVKNQLFLIEVINELVSKGFDNIELHLIGKEGELGYKNKLIKLIEKYKLTKKIIFHGFTNPFNKYNECDIFVLSSTVEGFPMVTLEAMSVGTPIISTKAGGSEEQIVEGYNGFLIEQNDIQNFVKKIIFFLQNKNEIENFGKNGFELFNKEFTIDNMIKQYTRIICEEQE